MPTVNCLQTIQIVTGAVSLAERTEAPASAEPQAVLLHTDEFGAQSVIKIV
jgi:hypothetical protein